MAYIQWSQNPQTWSYQYLGHHALSSVLEMGVALFEAVNAIGKRKKNSQILFDVDVDVM